MNKERREYSQARREMNSDSDGLNNEGFLSQPELPLRRCRYCFTPEDEELFMKKLGKF